MTSTARIVFTNGSSTKCSVIRQRLSWIIVRRHRKKTYYPVEQIRTVDYRSPEDVGFQTEKLEGSL